MKGNIGRKKVNGDWPTVNGNVSFWMDQVGVDSRRPALPGNREVDVAIVGAGYTGLWTAYYLLKENPNLKVAVLEKEYAGYGASGRNGGWLSAEPAGDMNRYAKDHGVAAARKLQQEMFHTVREVVEVAEREGIDADIEYDGLVYFATNEAQQQRLRNRVENSKRWGWTPEDNWILSGDEVRERVNIEEAVGGFYTPHNARVQPAKLVRGLAEVVEKLGATIYEDTQVTHFGPGKAVTDRGTVKAKHVLVALEGYLSRIEGYGRRMLPMNSSMLITEQIPDDIWAQINWKKAETLGDAAHSFTYIQHTTDQRIALGGRGVPLDYNNGFDPDGHIQPGAIKQLRERLYEIFPLVKGLGLAHSWTGVLGVPRDWSGTVNYDRSTGFGMAGGYVGHGVAGANLAGRTLADFVCGKESELTNLAWIGRDARKWEPEPLRTIGASLLYKVYGFADDLESRTASAKTSPVAKIANIVAGR